MVTHCISERNPRQRIGEASNLLGLTLRLLVMLCVLAVVTPNVRVACAEDEPDMSLLNEWLKSPRLENRRDATYELAELGEQALPALDGLIYVLEDRDQQVWNKAALAIANLGAKGAPAIDELLVRSDSRDEQRRYRMAHALGSIGLVALPKLRSHLTADSRNLREVAVDAIGHMGSTASEATSDLVLRLDDEDESIRRYAATSLGKIGVSAIPTLLEALQHAEAHVVAGAIDAISEMGLDAESTTPQLLALSAHEDEGIRTAVVRALGRTSFNDPNALAPLVAGIQSDSESVRRESVGALLRLSPALEELVTPKLAELLRAADKTPSDDASTAEDTAADKNESTDKPSTDNASALVALVLGGFGPRAVAATPLLLERFIANPNSTEFAKAIGRIGEPAVAPTFDALRAGMINAQQVAKIVEGMPAHVKVKLAKSLDDANSQVRTIAVLTIGKLVPMPRNAVEQLQQSLRDDAADVRAAGTKSLRQIGIKARPALPRLVEIAHHETDPAVTIELLRAIGELQPNAEQLVGDIRSHLGSPHSGVRQAALVELAKLKQLPDDLHATLVRLIQDGDANVRSVATRAIVLIQGQRDESAKWIVAAMKDDASSVREQALLAIPALGNAAKPAVSVIQRELHNETLAVRIAAVRSLAGIGEPAASAFTDVADMAGDADPEVRTAVVTHIRNVSPSVDQVLPVLIKALEDVEWGVRRIAAEQLGEMEEDAIPAVPALLEMLRRDDESDAARQAIREINTAGDEAVPTLLDILQDKEAGRRSRYYAVYLLRKMGPRAKSALPALDKLAEAADGRERESLERAIREIRVEAEDE